MQHETRRSFEALALELVAHEREYQRTRWTTAHDAHHTPIEWLAILTVWIGKAAMASPIYQAPGNSRQEFIKRLAQVAAICTAAIEAMLEDEDEAKNSPPAEEPPRS